MSGLFDTARDAIARELERFRNRRFLEATMAASALVAHADGEMKFAEMNTLDQALDAIRELNIYDPHEAVDVYRDYMDALRADEAGARERAFEAVARIAGDAHGAGLLLKVCVAIGKADNDFSDRERAVIAALCETLQVDPAAAGI
jgi:tellurite resistance protein